VTIRLLTGRLGPSEQKTSSAQPAFFAPFAFLAPLRETFGVSSSGILPEGVIKDAIKRIGAPMVKDAVGASASLNRTITEIMRFLEDDGYRPGGRGADLRGFLHEKIADCTERWFRKGFNRGHRESFGVYEQTGAVPVTLRYECAREVFTGQERTLLLKSQIKKKTGKARK
jgi:hypothetical protein